MEEITGGRREEILRDTGLGSRHISLYRVTDRPQPRQVTSLMSARRSPGHSTHLLNGIQTYIIQRREIKFNF